MKKNVITLMSQNVKILWKKFATQLQKTNVTTLRMKNVRLITCWSIPKTAMIIIRKMKPAQLIMKKNARTSQSLPVQLSMILLKTMFVTLLMMKFAILIMKNNVKQRLLRIKAALQAAKQFMTLLGNQN